MSFGKQILPGTFPVIKMLPRFALDSCEIAFGINGFGEEFIGSDMVTAQQPSKDVGQITLFL